MNNKKIISIMLVIIWMIVIYSFSATPSIESNEKSTEIVTKVVEKVETTTSNNTNVSNVNKQNEIEILNIYFRKFAHASIYFVLCALLINAVYQYNKKVNIKYILLCILICFIYACTDEYHQTFVLGRTGQFTDVIIDTIGSIFCCLLYLGIYKIFKLINRNKKELM